MRREKSSGGRSQTLKEPGEEKKNCAPPCFDSPMMPWCQALVADGPGLFENRCSIAYAFLKLRKLREKESKRKWILTCTFSTVLDLLKSIDRTLLISKGFDSELKEKEKTMWHGAELMAQQLWGNAQSFAQSYMCLSNILLPWIALETCSIWQDPWKYLKYGLIYTYLTENINVLPDYLWVK